MSEYRAILVSRDDILPEIPGERASFRLAAVTRMIEEFDAAGDQRRILRCKSCEAICDCYDTCAQHRHRITGEPNCYGPFEPGLFVLLPEQP